MNLRKGRTIFVVFTSEKKHMATSRTMIGEKQNTAPRYNNDPSVVCTRIRTQIRENIWPKSESNELSAGC